MPTPISVADALLLLRKSESEGLPVEIIGQGSGEQAMMLIGFIRVNEEDDSFVLQIPEQFAVVFALGNANMEYAEPREAPPEHHKRANRLLQFLLTFETNDWKYLIRVWNKPKT